MQEGVDAIVIDAVASPEAAAAVVVALAAGNLVLATIASSGVRAASDQLLALVPADHRDLARAALERGLLGTIAPVVKSGARSFEVVAGRSG